MGRTIPGRSLLVAGDRRLWSPLDSKPVEKSFSAEKIRTRYTEKFKAGHCMYFFQSACGNGGHHVPDFCGGVYYFLVYAPAGYILCRGDVILFHLGSQYALPV